MYVPGDEFAAGHVPGSVNIALSGQFASWAGTVLGLTRAPCADRGERISRSKKRGYVSPVSASKPWMGTSRAVYQRGRQSGFARGDHHADQRAGTRRAASVK